MNYVSNFAVQASSYSIKNSIYLHNIMLAINCKMKDALSECQRTMLDCTECVKSGIFLSWFRKRTESGVTVGKAERGGQSVLNAIKTIEGAFH